MRIGIDARFYGAIGKGLGRYTEKLIEHLERIDTGNEYVVFLREENFSAYEPKNPRFRKALADYQWYSFAEQIAFPLFLRRFRLDLMHFPHFNVPILYRGEFVVTIHDLILLRYPTVRNTTRLAFLYWMKFAAYRFVIASAIRRAAHIITVSHFAKQDILAHYPEAAGKVSVTYEAADPFCRMPLAGQEDAVLGRLGLRTGERGRDILRPYFLYVGNAYPHKNLGLLIETAERMPEYRFVLVGKSDHFYMRLERETSRRHLSNVVFAGFLADQELSILYRHAAAYVFPSLYEGFGFPAGEAMACGLPVISSSAGALPEVVGPDGEAGVLVPPANADALAAALKRVMADEELRRRMGAAARRRVETHFTWEQAGKQTVAVYEELIADAHR